MASGARALPSLTVPDRSQYTLAPLGLVTMAPDQRRYLPARPGFPPA